MVGHVAGMVAAWHGMGIVGHGRLGTVYVQPSVGLVGLVRMVCVQPFAAFSRPRNGWPGNRVQVGRHDGWGWDALKPTRPMYR